MTNTRILAAPLVCLALLGCYRKGPTGADVGKPTVGGAIQAVKGAAQRTVTLNELNNLRLMIDTASGASGRMPDANFIMDAAKKEDPKLFAMLQDGTIVLGNPKTRDGVWAYVAEAKKTRGQVVTASGIEMMTAAELEQRLQSGL